MKENLETSRFNDDTPIPLVADNTSWVGLSSPGYCDYANGAAYFKTYGALYNWYAVATGKLCPVGFHVPSSGEWLVLAYALGGESVAGGKLKETGTTHWTPPNTGATNESGFTALPAGNRIGAAGGFYNVGGYAIFWSSSQSSATQAIDRVLEFDLTSFRIGYDNKTAGFSVRCLAD